MAGSRCRPGALGSPGGGPDRRAARRCARWRPAGRGPWPRRRCPARLVPVPARRRPTRQGPEAADGHDDRRGAGRGRLGGRLGAGRGRGHVPRPGPDQHAERPQEPCLVRPAGRAGRRRAPGAHGPGPRPARADRRGLRRDPGRRPRLGPPTPAGRAVVAPAGRSPARGVRRQGHRTHRAPVDAETLRQWTAEPTTGTGNDTVADILARHEAELWSRREEDGSAYLRLLLPLAEYPAGEQAKPTPQAFPETRSDEAAQERPEFYDFDLFQVAGTDVAWEDRPLDEAAYTVFDTETTGLQPAEGDEIIAIGAVRVVNGRLLRQETFDRLIDPHRPVSSMAQRIHGISGDVLRGQAPASMS